MDLTTFDPKQILMCQQRRIGDVVMSTIAVELLAARYPGAEIDVLTEKVCAPVFAHNPHVARVHALDKKLHGGLAGLAFARRVAKRGHDLLIDFQQLPRLKTVALLSRARVKLSFRGKWYNRLFYTHTVRPTPGYAGLSKVSILKPLGIAWNGQKPRVYLADGERAWARDWLAGHGAQPGSVVTIDPTHRHSTRRWPMEHFAELLDLMAEARPELRFYVVFGPGEEQVARNLASACRYPDQLIAPERVHTLRELAAVIDQARLHIGNCSAPRHLAVAVDTPSLAVHGATGRSWTFPAPEHGEMVSSLDCWHCNLNACPQADERGAPPCLTGQTPDSVLPAALEMLDTGLLREHRQAK